MTKQNRAEVHSKFILSLGAGLFVALFMVSLPSAEASGGVAGCTCSKLSFVSFMDLNDDLGAETTDSSVPIAPVFLPSQNNQIHILKISNNLFFGINESPSYRLISSRYIRGPPVS